MADINNSLRVKIKTVDQVHEVKREQVETKSLKQFDEYDSPSLRVLGVPFSGPYSGRDADGEAFHDKTDIWLKVGDVVPVTYYHGFGPDDPSEFQPIPLVIGRAKYEGVDERGHWFEAKLDGNEPLALRIIEGTEKSRASSGAISHLVRMGKAGMIDVWPIGELAIFDTNEWRLPANDFAVIERKSLQEATIETEPVEMVQVKRQEIHNLENYGETKKMEDDILKDEGKDEPKDEPKVEEVKAAPIDIKPLLDEIKALREAVEAPPKQSGVIVEAPAIKKVTDMGFKDDQMKSFRHWIRTGDEKAYKAAMQEGTAVEGGYLVPDDFYDQIVSKRNEISVARRAGARVIQTSRDVVQVPVEGTQASFSIVAEEAAYGESEPAFSQVSLTVYKSTLLIKISEELLEDNATNLDAWLTLMIGERWGVHENAYTIAGSGSSQPSGVLTGGTAGLTFDDTNTIAAGEIPELFYKLKEQYMANASWSMEQATMGFLMGLTGNQFQLFTPGAGPALWNLWGKPVFPAADMGSYSTTAHKSLIVGDWSMYGIAERRGLTISRNPFLYQANGQVGLFCSVRWGGSVLQAEAFQYGTQA